MSFDPEILESVLAIAYDESRKIIDASQSALHVAMKSSFSDLVTDVDEEIERSLSTRLRNLIKDSQVLGEESQTEVDLNAVLWIVDPVDGTTNLIHGLPYSAVSVALSVDSEVRLATVVNPFTKEMFFAVKGRGSFVRGRGLDDRRLNVSELTELQSSLVSFGLPYDRRHAPVVFEKAEVIFEHCQDLRRLGSAALDIVSIARGHTQAHFEMDLRFWDVAAATLILQEAGGHVTTWTGETPNWESTVLKQPFLASNGHTHAELLALLS